MMSAAGFHRWSHLLPHVCHLHIFFMKYLFMSPAHFQTRLFGVFFGIEFWVFFVHSRYQSPVGYELMNIFFKSLACPFTPPLFFAAAVAYFDFKFDFYILLILGCLSYILKPCWTHLLVLGGLFFLKIKQFDVDNHVICRYK